MDRVGEVEHSMPLIRGQRLMACCREEVLDTARICVCQQSHGGHLSSHRVNFAPAAVRPRTCSLLADRVESM
jgi:hypothetical protein